MSGTGDIKQSGKAAPTSKSAPDAPRGASSFETLRGLSERHGMPGIDLSQVVIPAATLRMLPLAVARRAQALPFSRTDQEIHVALGDPGQTRIVEEIEFATGRTVRPYVAVAQHLENVLVEAHRAVAAGASHHIGPRAPRDYLVSLGLQAPEAPEANDDSVAMPAPRPGQRTDAGPNGPALDPAFGSRIAPLPTTRPRRPTPDLPPLARTVLIADADDEARRMLRDALTARGFAVVEARSGSEALQQVRERTPDVLVLDVQLPEIAGFEICRRIRASQRYGHIPIVLSSAVHRGWRFVADLKDSFGVPWFLEKPFALPRVFAAVEAALREPGRAPEEPEPQPAPEASEALAAGIEAYRSGDLPTAIAYLRQGVDADPAAFRLRYHLGLLYGRSEDVFGAIQELEAAVELSPNHFSSLKNLAILQERAGFRRRAFETWARALDSAPDDETRRGIKDHLVSLL